MISILDPKTLVVFEARVIITVQSLKDAFLQCATRMAAKQPKSGASRWQVSSTGPNTTLSAATKGGREGNWPSGRLSHPPLSRWQWLTKRGENEPRNQSSNLAGVKSIEVETVALKSIELYSFTHHNEEVWGPSRRWTAREVLSLKGYSGCSRRRSSLAR